VRIVVEQTYPRSEDIPSGRIALTAQARRLLELALDEARLDGHDLIGTAHIALACSHHDQLPSLEPFVAGRVPAIREQALRALGRRSWPELDSPLLRRREALAKANAVRTRRAALKRDLRTGRMSIGALLLDPPSYVENAKIADLLLALRRFGRVKVDKLLTHCGISPSKTVGGLSERQRETLVRLLQR
jgi:hypothetical protein